MTMTIEKIRYTGLVTGKDCKSAVVLAGTVFREILVWKIANDSDKNGAHVLHRLRGHNVKHLA